MYPGRSIRAVRARMSRLFACLTAMMGALAIEARADEVVQGVLQLRWGDAPAAVHGKPRAAHFEAWLDAGPDKRYRLDAEQARRAAGDLYALANRRVAVAYRAPARVKAGAAATVAVQATPEISAIVAADLAPSRTMARGDVVGARTATTLAGSTRWVTVMCKFADVVSEQKSHAFFQAQYGNAPGQLGHYWSEVSYGRIDLAGSTAHGWYTLPRPRASYLSVVNGRTKADLSQLFADCTAQADAEVDFRGAQGINLMFNAELDGSAWGGGACATMDGSYQCTRATWNPPWAFSNLAPLAHEMGHGYGLPHSDNTDGDADTYDNPWDLMSDAWRNAVSDATHGLLPKQLNMAQRDRLGWVAPESKRVLSADNGAIHDVMLAWADGATGTGTQMLVLAQPTQPDPYRTVVYVLEARRRYGSYDGRLAGDAVIIHVLEDYGIARSIDTDTPAADLSNNEGSMLRAGESWRTPDERHWVEVVSMTASGFLVRVGPRPRAMSTPSQVLVRSNVSAAQGATPSVRTPVPPAAPTSVRQARPRTCDVLPRVLRLPTLCAVLAR